MTHRGARQVDVGGYALAAHVRGIGGPTVVLEAAHGFASASWVSLLDPIAEFTTVCSYDRAGLGESDAGPGPRSFHESVLELHRVLEVLALPRPYVLVGHSIGGLLTRIYTQRYPTEVAGMVLVDASHPNQYARFEVALPPLAPDEPPALGEYRRWVRHRTSDEWDDPAACFAQARNCGGLDERPLAVLSAGKLGNPFNLPEALAEGHARVWHNLQAELARLSSRSVHRVAETSGHFIQSDQPELVLAAIREVVVAVRSS